MKVILASQSKYRRQLLQEHGVPIIPMSPTADEEQIKQTLIQEGYPIKSIGLKLAEAKALSVQSIEPEAIIIGCDQICVFDNHILNKPGTIENNISHLKRLSGNTHYLYTCVCILGPQQRILFCDTVELNMKALTDQEIIDYVHLDMPLDCAGGYKYEENGHTLFSSVHTEDPSSIQGLPLKHTLELLRTEFKVLKKI